MAKRRIKRTATSGDMMKLAAGVGGGIAANQLTNMLESQSFMAGKEKYAPLATLAVGIGAFLFAPNDLIRQLGFGMTVVSGTEQAEGLISGATGNVGQIPNYNLGFTPQVVPGDNPIMRTPDGVSIR